LQLGDDVRERGTNDWTVINKAARVIEQQEEFDLN